MPSCRVCLATVAALFLHLGRFLLLRRGEHAVVLARREGHGEHGLAVRSEVGRARLALAGRSHAADSVTLHRAAVRVMSYPANTQIFAVRGRLALVRVGPVHHGCAVAFEPDHTVKVAPVRSGVRTVRAARTRPARVDD